MVVASQIMVDSIANNGIAADERMDTVKAHEGDEIMLVTAATKSTSTSSPTTSTTGSQSTTASSIKNDDDDGLDDAELIRQAEAYFAEQRHLKAAKLLHRVSEQSRLTAKHHRILDMANAAEQVHRELSQPHPVDQGGWSQVGHRHGHRNTVIYYKVTKETRAVKLRVETPIEASLVVPLLAVINESDLYPSWNPSWKHPRLGLSETACLGEFARGHKLVTQLIDIPFPFAARELLVDCYAVDAIDSESDSDSSWVVLKIVSVGEGVTPEGVVVGPASKGVKRVDFDAGILIRPCPPDHPSLWPNNDKHTHHHRRRSQPSSSSASPHQHGTTDPTPTEPQILVSLIETCDAHVAGIPMAFINFAARVCMGQQWGALLQVAEQVRDGQRPVHQQCIADQPELYQWMNDRVQIMVAQQVAAAAAAAAAPGGGTVEAQP